MEMLRTGSRFADFLVEVAEGCRGDIRRRRTACETRPSKHIQHEKGSETVWRPRLAAREEMVQFLASSSGATMGGRFVQGSWSSWGASGGVDWKGLQALIAPLNAFGRYCFREADFGPHAQQRGLARIPIQGFARQVKEIESQLRCALAVSHISRLDNSVFDALPESTFQASWRARVLNFSYSRGSEAP